MGDGAAGRSDLCDLEPGLHEGVAAAGFGQPVGVDVAGVGEILREGANARFRRFFAAADRPSQAGDVIAFAIGAGEDGRRHDRREPGRVEPVGLDRSQALRGVEIALNAEHSALPQHRDAGKIERADMIERAGDQQPCIAAEAERQHVIRRFPVDVLVSQHHALRPVGGAGGVHQPHQVGWKPAMRRCRLRIRCKPRGVGLRCFIDQDDGRGSGRARAEFLVGDQKRARRSFRRCRRFRPMPAGN